MGSWRRTTSCRWRRCSPPSTRPIPNITVSFEPTLNTEYNAGLRTALETGNAPDLFYLRSYATGRALFEEGFVAPLTDVGLEDVVQRGQPRPVVGRRRHLRAAVHRRVARHLLQRRPLRRARHRGPRDVGRPARRGRDARRRRHHAVRQRGGRRVDDGRDHVDEPRPELHRWARRTARLRVRRAVPERRGHRQRVPGAGRPGAVPARGPGSAHLHRQPAAVAARGGGDVDRRLVGHPLLRGSGADLRVERVPDPDARGRHQGGHVPPRRRHRHQRRHRAHGGGRRPSSSGSPRQRRRRSWPPSCRASSRCRTSRR